ncbi:hypothetical protein QYE76_062301, partial [Lolium multiflorum]
MGRGDAPWPNGPGAHAPKAQAGQPLGFPKGINLGEGKALSPLWPPPPNPRWEGGHPSRLAPYIKRGGGAGHHPPSLPPPLAATPSTYPLKPREALFFLHYHHHAVVLLELGGDLPHLCCPLERERKELHRHRTRDRVRKCCRIAAPGTIVYTNNEINLVSFGIFEDHGAPSINFNQFLEKEKLKGNGSNFTTGSVILEAELQKRFEHHDPCDMMRELKLIFETHAAVESYEASKQFFSCMMEEGSSVSEHMFAMSGHAKKLIDMGMMIPNQLGIHRVLQSLPP